MRSRTLFLWPLTLAACGGGGGSDATPPGTNTARLSAPAVTIPLGNARANLTVALVAAGVPQPVLLQAKVELPPQLRFDDVDRLVPVAPVETLDGRVVDGRLLLLCGDTSNATAPALPVAELFRVGIRPSAPRQPGTYVVVLRDVRMASSAGDAVAVDGDTVEVPVTIL